MNRRSFTGLIAALPFFGWLKKDDDIWSSITETLARTPKEGSLLYFRTIVPAAVPPWRLRAIGGAHFEFRTHTGELILSDRPVRIRLYHDKHGKFYRIRLDPTEDRSNPSVFAVMKATE